MKNFIIATVNVITSFPAYSQNLFESSFSCDDGNNKNVEINGYVRSDIFANESHLRSVYGETSLKLETRFLAFQTIII